MIGTPRLKKKKPGPAVNPVAIDTRVKEAPELSGTFRERRF
jgi:hypothetical protein